MIGNIISIIKYVPKYLIAFRRLILFAIVVAIIVFLASVALAVTNHPRKKF